MAATAWEQYLRWMRPARRRKHSFSNSYFEGMYPVAGLIRDSAGNLYGTTLIDGDAFLPCGTVYEFTLCTKVKECNRLLTSLGIQRTTFDRDACESGTLLAGIVDSQFAGLLKDFTHAITEAKVNTERNRCCAQAGSLGSPSPRAVHSESPTASDQLDAGDRHRNVR